MLRSALCAIVLSAVSLNAFAQFESGTLIVLNSSPDEIVVAADSRAVNAVGQSDDSCKIAALGGELVFASSGKSALVSDQASLAWDSHVVARNLFLRLSARRTKQPMPMRLALAWGKKVEEKMQSEIRRDPKGILLGAEDNTLITALFAGFDHNAPFFVTGTVTYETEGGVPTRARFSITGVKKSGSAELGKVEIAHELFGQHTERARQWFSNLQKEMYVTDDGIAAAAISAVKMTIDHYPAVQLGNRMVKVVGGPIDAVKLTPQGIQWIQRKPNCPKD